MVIWESWPFTLLLGTLLGGLAGLGVGGGSLLILWLTMVLEMPQAQARGINLLFFLPAAGVSCFFRWQQGVLKPKTVFPAILAGCLSAAVFSWLGGNLETVLLKKGFGLLLILTGTKELLFKQKSSKHSS